MPQFAGGEFLMNLGELMDARASSPIHDFVPELLALGDFPPGSGLRGIPWVGNVQVFAWRTDVLEELGLEAPPEDVGRRAHRRPGDHRRQRAETVSTASACAGRPAIRPRPASCRCCAAMAPISSTRTGSRSSRRTQAMQAITTQLALAKLAPPGVENVGHAEKSASTCSQGIIAQSADIWPDQLLQIYDPELSKVVGMVDIGGEPAQEGVEPGQHDRQLAARHPGGEPERRRRARLHPLVHRAGAADAAAARPEHPGHPHQRHGEPGGGREAAVPAGPARRRPQCAAATAHRTLQRGRGDLRPLRRRGDRRPDLPARRRWRTPTRRSAT